MVECDYTSREKRDVDGGLVLEDLFEDGVMKEYPQDHACLLLEAANLPPLALIDGLVQYMHQLINQKSYLRIGMLNPPAINIAKQLAIPHAFFEDDMKALQVSTISEYFYRTGSDSWTQACWWKNISKILPGEWTLIMIGEIDKCDDTGQWKSKVRYAFVTTAPPNDNEDATSTSYVPKVVVKDFYGFLDSVVLDKSTRQQISNHWESAILRARAYFSENCPLKSASEILLIPIQAKHGR